MIFSEENMKKHLRKMALILVMVVLLMSGCSILEEAEDEVDDVAVQEMHQDYEEMEITIATGGTGGVYFPLGGAMATIFNTYVPGLKATAESTGAAIANIDLIRTGEAKMAFAQNDITYYAYTGTEMYSDEMDLADNVRGLAVLYPEIIQIVSLVESEIDEVEDLRGKRIAIGAERSGTEANATHILQIHGIEKEDLEEVHSISFAQAVMKMRNGQIDAAFVTAGIPTSAISEMIEYMDVSIVPIRPEIIRMLSDRYPFYVEVDIPAGTYEGQETDVTTTAVMAMLVVSSDLPEMLVYNMTQAIFEHQEFIAEIHERGNDIILETALIGMPVDLHPGAARFYEKHVK
ncbi:hypothetical protein SAMN05192546_102245 [Tindallia californiensis]|uniref:TRAP transporter solute receptor, TAXI family n=2 Tax=Tindallia californiensis TaxID=159292 RepID=A0A1H3K6D7_9FIRM|nr:hypothetical protein SAMN05192546_102245 [Tindallia californiensis]